MACHDYCIINPMPVGTRSLLGLGLKYCLKKSRPTNRLDKTIEDFKNNSRRIAYFHKNPREPEEESTYNKDLYLKKSWEAPEASEEVEECLTNFERELCRRQVKYKRLTLSNLTLSQWKLTEQLNNNDYHIVIEADKNLGGCILDRAVYNTRAIKEHLGNTTVYQLLTKTQAHQRNHVLRYRVNVWLSKWQDHIALAERIFLRQAMQKYPDKLARFRMSLKAHKNPWKMRPIVCCSGTFINCLSRWLDHWLQKLKPLLPTYIKNSTQLLQWFEDLGVLPHNAYLFTADANSMYTNIDTDHAIKVISEWLDSLHHNKQLPANFPLEAVKEAMMLVMKNNIFEWGDLHFLQLLGTAMGTSAACMWATIYFAVHEMGTLIPKYGNRLPLFGRFIDDIIGVWIDDGNAIEWQNFKRDTDDFGILTWEFEELARSVNFLDLTIEIKNNKIVTKTFQKALNLYQYIGPLSCHQPKMMEGIIYSLMSNYRRQNTYTKDYHAMAIHLFDRHVARGWNRATMKDYILKADHRINLPQPVTNHTAADSSTQLLSNKERLFFHMEYHTNDIPKTQVRALYDHYCKSTFEGLGIKQFTVAYSRPPNIKDSVTKAKLHQAPGKEASKYYSGELSNE